MSAAVLLHDAPHLAQPIPFVMPSYRWWETGFYGIGLKLYDFLAGAKGLGPHRIFKRCQCQSPYAWLEGQGLAGWGAVLGRSI
jgi:glycerol-3-phosphate dehydrogenase